MKPTALLPLLLALFLVGCDSILTDTEVRADPAAATPGVPPTDPPQTDEPVVEEEPAPPAYAATVNHPYFRLTPGRFWTFVGEDEGELRRDEVEVLAEAESIAGVACAAVRQEVYLEDELVEVTTEWFAQDADGNLWKFGEESHEFDDEAGVFVRTDDSWVAGIDDIEPWVFFPAAPREGDEYLGFQPDGEERMEVLSLTTTAIVPAGTFGDCMEVLETTVDVEDADIVIYAPEVGVVSETSQTGYIELVETGVR